MIIISPDNILMESWASRNLNPSLMYAENCPEEPLILESTLSVDQPPIQQAKPTPKIVKSNMVYHPHIITVKKWSQTSAKGFEEMEHERELSILQMRIKNCKSLTQRKKDHNDPILYPAYFIREKKRCKDARIDGYFRRVLQGGESKPIKRKQTHRVIKDIHHSQVQQEEQDSMARQTFWKLQQRDQKRFTRSNFPLPPVTHLEINRKQSHSLLNLPPPDFQSIASFIIDRRMFLEDDLRILKARLFHNYGSSVEREWRQAIYYVLRNRPHD